MSEKPKKKTIVDYPELVAQWHPTKNGDLRPEDVSAGSNKKVWWKCPKGPDHEWIQPAGTRVRGAGCKACNGYQLSVTNRLTDQFPAVAKQWHPTKNGELRPQDFVAGSGVKVWWKCPNGPDHEWQTRIVSRTRAGASCPVCHSLAHLYPEIAEQWHPQKNGSLSPNQIKAGSDKRVFWLCPVAYDHEWKTAVYNRTGLGTGCPACAGVKASITNSLASLAPAVAKEWHPTRNGDATPNHIVAGSEKRVWWKCPNGPEHEWRATVVARSTGRGGRCPKCNSLAGKFPEVAAELHPRRNGSVTGYDLSPRSPRRVWWQCSSVPQHEWKTTIASRTGLNTGCPQCANKAVSRTNSLSHCFPDVAAQWHPTKNRGLTPNEVVAGSHKKVWWKCPAGPDHEWRGSIVNRTRGRDCPACAGKQLSVTNRLTDQFPAVAKQWHPTKNGELRPDDFIAGTPKKVWWKCPNGPEHEWITAVVQRTREGSGCPHCSIVPRSKQEIRLAFELAHHIPIDQEFHKIKTARRLWDVDICAPALKLVIEFDGSFWHAEKGEKDRAKAKNLRRNGWRVVRVREAPLKKLSKWNVVIPTNADAHEAALLVLEHLQSVLDLDIPRMDERQAAEGPLCAKEAEAYIEKLLAEKQAAEAQ